MQWKQTEWVCENQCTREIDYAIVSDKDQYTWENKEKESLNEKVECDGAW